MAPAALTPKTPAAVEQHDAVVIHLLSAARLPRLLALNRSLLAPYAIAWLRNERGEALCDRVTWRKQLPGTREPVWNVARELPISPERRPELAGAKLRVELWDCDDLLSHNLIGHAEVPLDTLEAASHCAVPIVPSAHVLAPPPPMRLPNPVIREEDVFSLSLEKATEAPQATERPPAPEAAA